MMMRFAVVWLVGCGVLLAGCGTAAGPAGSVTSSDAGQYFFDRVRFVHNNLGVTVFGDPKTIADAAPCGQASDHAQAAVVVAGRVSAVEPGDGVVWGDEEDEISYTNFEDPTASERDVVMTIEAAQVMTPAGVETGGRLYEVRMGVLAGADPEKFRASLASLESVVLLLDKIGGGRHAGEFYPMLGGAGVGVVTADGSIAFPGLGDRSASFAKSATTTDALFELCP